jgi:hypothetical protein
MNTKEITVRVGYHAIQASFSTYLDGNTITKDEATQIAFLVNNDLQLRDYVMGMSNDYHNDTAKVVAWLEALIEAIGEPKNAYALLTVISMYYYEANETGRAILALDLVDEVDPNYSLAKLIRRVIVAGWPQGSVASMRTQLHEKVRATILDTEYSESIISNK